MCCYPVDIIYSWHVRFGKFMCQHKYQQFQFVCFFSRLVWAERGGKCAFKSISAASSDLSVPLPPGATTSCEQNTYDQPLQRKIVKPFAKNVVSKHHHVKCSQNYKHRRYYWLCVRTKAQYNYIKQAMQHNATQHSTCMKCAVRHYLYVKCVSLEFCLALCFIV